MLERSVGKSSAKEFGIHFLQLYEVNDKQVIKRIVILLTGRFVRRKYPTRRQG